MVDATIERGSTKVTLPLVDGQSGTPVVGTDIGKPNINIQRTGSLDPRSVDQSSGLEQYTLLGQLTGTNAYSDANTLADLIKSNSNGTELVLNIGMSEFDTDISVAPAAGQDESLALAYQPGRSQWVDVDLKLTRIDETLGGSDQSASTPTASGTGPIQISDNRRTVDLTDDIVVQRSVGRPNSPINQQPDRYPKHTDKHKTAYDAFELAYQITGDVPTEVGKIREMFGTRLRNSSLTLDFNGLFNLGSFNVVPEGSDGLRHIRPTGEQGTTLIPTINLRRVV